MIIVFIFIFVLTVVFFVINSNYYEYETYTPELEHKYIRQDQTDKKMGNGKVISSEILSITNNKSLNVYFEIPKNDSFWTLGIFNKTECVDSLDISNFQTIEPGDTLHVVVSPSSYAVNLSIESYKKIHNLNYPYKRFINHIVNYSGDCYVKIEFYSIRGIKNIDVDVKEIFYGNIYFSPYTLNKPAQKISNISENIELFEDYISKNETGTRIETYNNFSRKNVSKNEVINMSSIISSDKEFVIYAVNHYKTKIASHSHLLFVDLDTNLFFRIEMTGVKTDKVLEKNNLEIRKISFKPPDDIKQFTVFERIFFDCDEGYVLQEKNSIPFAIFIR